MRRIRGNYVVLQFRDKRIATAAQSEKMLHTMPSLTETPQMLSINSQILETLHFSASLH
jgi:hypothetical protein